MKDGLKKDILKLLLLYLVVLITLVGTVLSVITLSNLYLELINSNLDLIGVINVSLVTILVLITGAYGYFTWQIVDETKTDRKVAFIERRLEKLYYPLREILRDYHLEIIWPAQKDFYEIIPYTYLASEKLKKDFDRFDLDFRINNVFAEEDVKEMLDIVDGDIKILNEKLNKIMGAGITNHS